MFNLNNSFGQKGLGAIVYPLLHVSEAPITTGLNSWDVTSVE